MADVVARDRAMCSTPEGITEIATLVLQRKCRESIICSTPEGIT
jgi:hypothetical protein